MLFFFFFKQKTAYEMRISDWSSDVCSSDLRRRFPRVRHNGPATDSDTGTGETQNLHHSLPRSRYAARSTSPFHPLGIPSPTGLPRACLSCVHYPGRSEERRVGKECVSTCSSRWSPVH